MNTLQAFAGTDTGNKVKEAETYYAMGLFDECLDVYEDIFASIPEVDAGNREIIKEKIDELKEEIRINSKKTSRTLPKEDMDLIKKTLALEDNITEIMDSAASFKELGLYKDAVDQYKKLVTFDYPIAILLPELVDCLFRIGSPAEVVAEIQLIIDDNELDAQTSVQIKSWLGSELDKNGHKGLARDLYKSVLDIEPENADIRSKYESSLVSISSGSKYDYLLDNQIVTSEQLQRALVTSKKSKKSVEAILIELFNVKKDEIAKSLSAFYGCPFKSFDPNIDIPVELISNLKKSFLLHDIWVPLSWSRDGVEILIDNPKDLRKTGQVKGLIKTKKIVLYVGIKEDIEKYISLFFDKKHDENVEEMVDELDMIPDIEFEEETDEPVEESSLDEGSSQVVKLVDQILVAAYRRQASDIHVEPSLILKSTGIRFRQDGVCQEYMKVPNSMSKGIISRLKIMAGLDIAERRLPQDGKIKFKRKGIPPFELRLATLPTAGDMEDAVLRVLAKAGAMKLGEMGLRERNFETLKANIVKPYGLVLVVGPTGSGKTTTLHAAIGDINKPGIKIWTAEDPVEISQPGLRQVEVKAKIGLDFARVMRAFLRADPDVIMIGEMRDFETAAIGVEASLTGHLVFSTLHTNSAPETVTRLLDMGLNPLNFSDAFLVVLAQRLVRKLCSNCKEEYHPSEEEFEDLAMDYGIDDLKASGIEYGPDLVLYRRVGCDICAGNGYKGRVGVHELMEGTPDLKKLIKKAESTEKLFEQARKDGMSTLKQDGIQKVLLGLTDIHEIRRVCA